MSVFYLYLHPLNDLKVILHVPWDFSKIFFLYYQLKPMSDESIWQTIGGDNFCAYKMKTDTITLCKHKNNVTGICEKQSCPLANSKYATVREIDKKLYLFIKQPDKYYEPKNMYQKILLSKYEDALLEIDKHLNGYDKDLIHKCKQRLTKLDQYLERTKIIEEIGVEKYEARRKLRVKQTKKEAKNVLNTVNFDNILEKEILERLELGIYGEEIKDLVPEKKVVKQKKMKRKFVAEFEESGEKEVVKQKKKVKEKDTIKW
ncbi:MAK16 Nuclear protein [Spraguea lophii 42_110]|uniref:Protein MAK16 n=1 Tax=Spraguea lophii (strain 42_110) TaxID=1358809 RepID=S7XFV7_SPRLO|nr:MAK16 Nuclear protein [Spraguea lophii 42_110]